jgi:hypothetical protein
VRLFDQRLKFVGTACIILVLREQVTALREGYVVSYRRLTQADRFRLDLSSGTDGASGRR